MENIQFDFFNKLKKNRANIRNRIKTRVAKNIEVASQSGHFPSFESIVNSIMDEISEGMDANREIEIEEWRILLQGKEPDRYCSRTMLLVSGLGEGEGAEAKEDECLKEEEERGLESEQEND